MKYDSVFFVERLQKLAHLSTENAFHRHPLRCYYVDFDIRARKAAAASRPMKLAPIIKALCTA
jgi:hypothetical protein